MTKFLSNELFFHIQIDASPVSIWIYIRTPALVENFHRFDPDKNRVSTE